MSCNAVLGGKRTNDYLWYFTSGIFNPAQLNTKIAEWMKFLKDNRAAVQTLEREKTYFESVFTEKIDVKLTSSGSNSKGRAAGRSATRRLNSTKNISNSGTNVSRKVQGKLFKPKFI